MTRLHMVPLLVVLLLAAVTVNAQDNRDDPLDRPDSPPDTTLLHDVEEGVGHSVIQTDRWLGLLCRPVDDVLRSHLDLPEGMGLVVDEIVPGSPAEKAGLQVHDILTKVDGEDLTSIHMLIRRTAESGENGLNISWLRKGEAESAVVRPEQRPDGTATFRLRGSSTPSIDRFREWVQRLEDGADNDGPIQFRFFGPGVQMDGTDGFPAGLSIQIERENDEPARITVRKGDSSWEVTEDTIAELPEDVRGTVEGMLKGGAGRGLLIQPMDRLPTLEFEGFPWPEFQRRFDEMDKQLRELREQMQEQVEEESDSIDA